MKPNKVKNIDAQGYNLFRIYFATKTFSLRLSASLR